MKIATKAHSRLLSAVALMALPVLVHAQGYYDDDIYYKPSKQKAQPTTTVERTTTRTVTRTTYTPIEDYPAADTYIVNSGSTRDVDEYNRHGQFLVADSVVTETETTTDTYSNTRRLQRFHNGDIVNTMSDDDYATYVITDPTQVNIYIDNPWYPSSLYWPYNSWRWGWSIGSPWWNLSWSLYDPWYWGPSWSWGPSWAWGPSWSWGWGPSWAWGPSWGPGWGPGWGHAPGWGPGPGHGPGWGVASRPHTPSGSSRPHNYAGATGGNYRPVSPSATNRVTGNASAATNGRPGNNGYGNGTVTNNRGQAAQSSGTPTQSTTRGRNNGTSNNVGQGAAGSRQNSNATTRQSTNQSRQNGSSTTRSSGSNTRSSSNSSSGSYNRSSSNSHSSGSYGTGGGGSRSSGSMGGGSRGSSGGGGGRGRR